MNNQALQLLIKDYFKLKFKHGVEPLRQNHLQRQLRKEIARHKTAIRQAELGGSND